MINPTIPTNPKHQQMMTEVENYTQQHLNKIAKHYDETGEFPHEPLQFFFEKRIFDLLTSASNEDFGTFLEMIRVVSKKFAGLASIILTQGFYAVSPLYHFGTEKQKETYLEDLLNGQRFGGFGLSEENYGGDPTHIHTTAWENEAGWVINGSKQYISNAPMANFFLIVAKAKKLCGSEGLGLFIVERGTKGFSISDPMEKMGIKSLPVASATLNQVAVTKNSLLGGEIRGAIQIEHLMNQIKLSVSMQAIGIAQGSFDKGLDYMNLVRKFGNRLIDNQSTQQQMADTKTHIYSSEAFLRQVIINDPQNTIEVAMAKLLTAEVAVETTESIIQLTGGYGYMKDSEIERYTRDAKVTAIYGGSSNSQRKIVAQPWIDGK